MRNLALWLAFLLATTLSPGLALADEAPGETIDVPAPEREPEPEVVEEEPEEEEDEEEEEPGAWGEYSATVGNRYKIGLNSFLTFPADPVMSTYQPDEEWDELPGAVVTKYPVGFFQGSLLMVHRATAGTFDLLFAPVTPMRMLSPEPRYLLFADAEHEEY